MLIENDFGLSCSTYIALHVFTQYVVNFAATRPTLSNQSSIFNQQSTALHFWGVKNTHNFTTN